MGFAPEEKNKHLYGKLRRYKCRVCGNYYKDYYSPPENRLCSSCSLKLRQEREGL